MSVSPFTNRRIGPVAVMNNRAALAYVDDVAIMETAVEKWTDKDVIDLLGANAQIGKRATSPAVIAHFLGETMGTVAFKRKLIVDWMAKNNIETIPRTITLTESVLMRAGLTAYSWLTRTKAKAFKTTELDVACAWPFKGLVAEPVKVKEAVQAFYQLVGKRP